MPTACEHPRHVDIAIIGGGASGVLVAAHLLAADVPRKSVALIDSGPAPGRGVAYGTGAPEHLLNVPAGGMSAFADDPGDFARFLAAGQGGEPSPGLAATFAPRRDYARYLRNVLESRPGFSALEIVHDRVSDIERRDGFHLQLASGKRLHADAVVLAIGNAPRRLAVPAALSDRLLQAWDPASLSGLPPESDVCIVGSGLSMVDVVLTLAEAGHRGRLHVLSRHGLMPLPHATSSGHAGAAEADAAAALLEASAAGRLRLLRRMVAEASAGGDSWQRVFERLRPHGQRLWQTWDEGEQASFLRHLVRYWDIHRHRIAPQVHAVLTRLQESGQLRIHAGRLLAAEPATGNGCRIRYRARGTHAEESLQCDWIVNATGIETRVRARGDDLAAALLARGLAVPGPHGLGFASRGIGEVVDAHGHVAPDLFVIGALRLGDLWETIAVPELRQHAAGIARHLLARGSTAPDLCEGALGRDQLPAP
ncbi:MAG: FAD/NAD(P)-binding protein [Xanthomonadales bacterium]|nr:FAD/NAD(P)-binding protein [Xanthomonadales bacterium]